MIRAGAGFVLVALALTGIVVLALLGPVRQDPAYHDFADRRTFLGIPNALDTLSNLPLLLAGGLGVAVALGKGRFRTAAERRAAVLFFGAVAGVGVGSALYHLHPTDGTLLYDRIPIAASTMALLALVLAERLDARRTGPLLFPLVLLGAATAVFWGVTGDLCPYGFAQYYPAAAILILLGMTRAPYTRASDYLVTLLLYGLAKVAEVSDRTVFDTTGAFSGHTLKHLLAAAAIAWVLRMVHLRRSIG